MARGASLLHRVAIIRRGWDQGALAAPAGNDFQRLAVFVLVEKQEHQGHGGSVFARGVSRVRLLWAAHDSVWLRLSRDTSFDSGARPRGRECAAVVTATAVLFMGEHSRFVGPRRDRVTDLHRLRPGGGPMPQRRGKALVVQ